MNRTVAQRIATALFASSLVIAPPMKAQIGSGWSSVPINGFVDYEVLDKHYQHDLTSFSLPSMYYTRGTGSETFGLKTADSNRVEHDTNDHYNTGTRQYEGYVQIHPGISMQSVVQIFGGGSGGPILMIKGYNRNNGALVCTRDTSTDLINNLFSVGKVRVNLMHDVDNHTLSIFINGVKKWTGADAGSAYTGSYNVKYGLYGSFNQATYVDWTNVNIWQGGSESGGTAAKYEAENLLISDTSGDTSAFNADSGASGGQYVQYYSNAAGNYIQFTVPNVAAGTYALSIGVKKYNNRGIVQTQVNKAGSTPGNIGSTIDLYSSTSSFTEIPVGTWSIGSTSDKWVKFLVTGKNPSSGGYNVAIDYIKLTPQ